MACTAIALGSRPAGRLKIIHQLPEATLLRVELADGTREVYSLLRNRARSNVAFMYGEELRYQPALDTLTIYPGGLTSYPNFMFRLTAQEVPEFVRSMELVRDAQAFDSLVGRWGGVAATPSSGAIFMTCRRISAKPNRSKPACWICTAMKICNTRRRELGGVQVMLANPLAPARLAHYQHRSLGIGRKIPGV